MVQDPHAERQAVIALAWAQIIQALGYDLQDPHLKDSPDRVAKFLLSWHTQRETPPKLTTFPNGNYDAIIAVGKIPFYSVCAHHGLPFVGSAAVGYLPGESKQIVGLSKLARVVEHFAHRFQTQEQITEQVAEHLQCQLRPLGVGVILQAEHLCMSMRGVKAPGHITTTSTMLGCFRSDAPARAELLSLLTRSLA
jgi:GTP cyclohydrolase I